MAPAAPAARADQVDGAAVAIKVEEDTLLLPVPEEKQLFLQFEEIKGWVSTKIGPPSLIPTFGKKNAETPEFRQIMHGISGDCKPGEVLALMGPSGSSKTSVLSVLGGRTPPSVRMEGKVLFNGEKLTKKIKKRIGYVLQDEVLYETLTTFETLYFAAILRLPKDMTIAAKEERVETVIQTLGLQKCRNTIIGGHMRRGVSGGERKRVSIGVELLINPSAVFLDEPTSGLDSTTAMHLLTTLRQLASGGRAVVTTIHQPSSRLYMQLDKLLLLSEGHVIYYGRANGAADWFEKLGYELPRGVNQADFFLDIASGDVRSSKLSGEDARLHCITCSEKYLETHPHGYQEGGHLSEADLGPELWYAAESRKNMVTTSSLDGDSGASHRSVSLGSQAGTPDDRPWSKRWNKGPSPNANAMIAKDAYGAGWAMQYMTLLRRALKVRRFEALSIQDMAQAVCLAVLGGLFWLQAGQTDTVSGAANANGLIFFVAVFSAIRTMLSALFVFPPEFKMILKERASGMYQVSSYYLARTSSDLPIDCTLPTVFVTILYFMGGLQYSAGQYFSTLFAVLLLVLVAQSFGLLIGAIVPNPKTAQTLTTIVALSMVLVAGFFAYNIPDWISWLKYVSFLYYTYSLVLKVQYDGRDLWNCGTQYVRHHTSAPPGTCSLVPSGDGVKTALRLNRSPDEAPWEAGALIGFLICMRFLVYVALRYKTKSKVR